MYLYIIMENNHRLQMLYQKNNFNNHKICQLDCIFKCCKCKKNNTLIPQHSFSFQFCLFCGTPNAVKREMNEVKNLR
jgi:hypothetical protein